MAGEVPTWEQATASMTLSATTAAAQTTASQIQIGSPFLVSPIQTLGLDSGNCLHFVLQKAVPARVSIRHTIANYTLLQVSSHRQTTLAVIQRTL